MPTLSSLLVQREIISMRTVEEAIARQVLHGGDLATNLIELTSVPEDALLACVAESFGMEPAPSGKLADPKADALRLIPADLALRHAIFPLAFDGGTLTVATSEPLSQAVEDDLGFALNVALRQVIATLVRIRQAIAAHYRVPLDRRMLRLIAKLEGAPDPSPTLLPPSAQKSIGAPQASPMPPSISIPPPNFGTGLPVVSESADGTDGEAARAAALDPEIPPPSAVPRMVGLSLAPSGSMSAAARRNAAGTVGRETRFVAAPPTRKSAVPAERTSTLPAERTSALPVERTSALPVERTSALPAERTSVLPTDAPAGDDAVTGGTKPPGRDAAATRGLASWLRRTVLAEKGHGADGLERAVSRPRRKGPFTAAMAEQELEDARTTEFVLDIYFAFARQFFAYSFLFIVHGDLAEGRNASGPGAALLDITSVGVPLNLPSTLALARKRRAPVIAAFSSEGLDAEFARDLGRAPAPGSPALAAAVIPVVVRNRVVALLYGDDGDVPVDLTSIGDVIAMTALTAGALERLILRRKLSAYRTAEAAAHPEGREATAAPSPNEASTAVPEPAPAMDAELDAALPFDEGEPLDLDGDTVPRLNRRSRAPLGRPPSLPPEIEVGWSVLPPPPVQQPAPRETLPAGSMPGAVAFDEGDTYAGMGPELAAMPRSFAVATLPSIEDTATEWLDAADAEVLDEDWWSTESRPSSSLAVRQVARVAAPQSAPVSLLRRSLVDRDKSLSGEENNVTAKEAVSGGEGRSVPEEDDSSEGELSWGVRSVRADADRAPATAHAAPLPARRHVSEAPVDLGTLISRVLAKGPDADRAFVKLVESGEQAMPLLMADFPGPLVIDRHRTRGELPAASRCGPILELTVAMGRPAVPFITARSSSSDVDVRFWATHVLGELCFAEAANAILPRLFDDDFAVRRVARRAAVALVDAGPAGAPIVQGLSHITRNIDEPTRRRVLAIETMGEIRAGSLVSPLISALADPTEDVSDSARRALVFITRQDFGADGLRWSEWWSKHAGRHRIEWLIDSLMHHQAAIRRAASDELKELTREYFGYHEELSEGERARAQGYYREWWDVEGRAKFRS